MLREPIAIVGVGCELPHARTLEELGAVVDNSIDAITVRSREDWTFVPPHAFQDERSKLALAWPGGYIDSRRLVDVDAMHAVDCPQEVDPQQTLFLHCALKALAHAGLSMASVGHAGTGVFAGVANFDYHRMLYSDLSRVSHRACVASAPSGVSSRTSHCLGLEGPSVSIDSACSSGLIAVHAACLSLVGRETEYCFAGGVNLILTPDSTMSFLDTALLSRSGRCRVFSGNADGYVRSEGCCVLLLTRLRRAAELGLPISGAILGSVIGHSGRSAGITAPRGSALINLIRKAHEATGVSTADVGYVEAHAVGTQVGDIIELRALNDVFSESPVYVGSVKTNIGHSEAVSGLAGILKALHIMKIKAIAPNLHFDGFNPRARLRSTKLKVAVSPAPWPSSAFASSVSAFGIMGANAHVVLTCDVGRCL